MHNFSLAANNRRLLDAIVLDISKAFDRVPYVQLNKKGESRWYSPALVR